MDAFIEQHLLGVSRTYAIVVPMLPAPLADAVGLAYLLMRIVDTLEDAPQLATAERVRLLERLEAALAGREEAVTGLAQPIGELEAERQLMCAAPEVLRRVAALKPEYRDAAGDCARAMSAGIRRLIQRSAQRGRPYPAIGDLAELREYCYYVAGIVGEMLCVMMAHHLRLPGLLRKRGPAVELGTGLQLVNILKDAQADARQGRRYLPPPAAAGLRTDRQMPTDSPASAEGVFGAVLYEARRSLERGIEYVLALPPDARELRAFCGLPIAWGAMTLNESQREPRSVKISREAIRASIGEFEGRAADDARLREWLLSLLHPHSHGVPADHAGSGRAPYQP